MNTLPNITAKENISKPIILNKFSIKNFILNSINLSIDNFSTIQNNCRNTRSKISCVTPENQSKIISTGTCPNAVIITPKGSTAEKVCIEQEIPYKNN